jgi:hypothetical protein
MAVSKLDAADRLIVGGIAMMERGDDPLAIHVVASSALNLLREMIQQGGDDYSARVLKEGAFYAASARLKGDPVAIPTTPEMDAIIDKVATGIAAGEVNKPSDLIINLDAEERRKLLDYIIRPFNFLKHAQRDPLATLEESDVDPKGAVIHAVTALSFVEPGRKLPEEVAQFLTNHGLA